MASCTISPAGSYATDSSADTDGQGVSSGATAIAACPAGHISSVGEYVCDEVERGSYATDSWSDSDGMGVSSGATHSVSCPPGKYNGDNGYYYCNSCTLGRWSSASRRWCPSCAEGRYGNTVGANSNSACSGPCAAGRYGDTYAQDSTCAGACPEGYYCVANTKQDTLACDEGNYWCSSSAPIPAACGGVQYYCPEGVGSPSAADAGYYTTPVDGDGTLRTGQATCDLGYYCDGGGARVYCPGGTYGDATGLEDPACSGQCQEGYYCSAGSTTATAAVCGTTADPPESVYCEAGVGAPAAANSGEVTTPLWGSTYTRTGAEACLTDETGKFIEVCEDGSRSPLVPFSSCPEAIEIGEKLAVDLDDPVANHHTGASLAYAILGAEASPTRNVSDFAESIYFYETYEDDSETLLAENQAIYSGSYTTTAASKYGARSVYIDSSTASAAPSPETKLDEETRLRDHSCGRRPLVKRRLERSKRAGTGRSARRRTSPR